MQNMNSFWACILLSIYLASWSHWNIGALLILFYLVKCTAQILKFISTHKYTSNNFFVSLFLFFFLPQGLEMQHGRQGGLHLMVCCAGLPIIMHA